MRLWMTGARPGRAPSPVRLHSRASQPGVTTTSRTGTGNSDGSTGAANWFNGTANVAWNDANNDAALFAGFAGTVTLTGARTASGLTFATNNYTLNGNTLDLGTSGSVTVNSALTANMGT